MLIDVSKPNRDKFLVITINHSHAGFFAYVNFALNQLIYAERHGFRPVVYFGRHSGDGPNAFYSVLPRAVTITVGAVPGNCLVSIDGHQSEAAPFTTSIVVGRHQFQFEWPGLGTSLTTSELIQTDGQRVFESSP